MGDEAVKVQLFRFIDVPAAAALARRRSPATCANISTRPAEHLPALAAAAACAGCPSTGSLGRLLAGTARAQRRAPGPPLHRRLQSRRSAARRRPRCAAGRWPSPSICSARPPSPRTKPSSTSRRVPRPDRRPEPDGQRLAGQRPASTATTAARCRASTSRSSCRRCTASSIRSTRTAPAGRCASGCGRSCALAREHRGLRQRRHGAVRLQGPDAAHLPRGPGGDGVPRLARRRHRHPGVPARHRRTTCASWRAWAERRGTPVWVRLVKGAYWDYETVMAAQQGWPMPVFTHKWETDASLRAADALPAGEPRLAAAGLRQPQRPQPGPRPGLRRRCSALPPRELSRSRCSTAWPTRSRTRWSALGQRVRVYTPYGQLLPGMAYLVRRLLENTANESFLRASFTEHVPEEQLLMNPLAEATNRLHAAGRVGNGPASACDADSPHSATSR